MKRFELGAGRGDVAVELMESPYVDNLPPEADPVLRLIGGTPLVPLDRFAKAHRLSPRVRFLAKLEWLNPGGSVKARPALRMIRAAESTGELEPGKVLLDATSGNTGIAYALIAARRGYPVELCLPANASAERKRILTALGAQITLTDANEGSDGAIRVARQRFAEHPGYYHYLDQYNNAENPRAHYFTTGAEIWTQTGGAVTHLVVGLGTSGTAMGAGRRLKELNPDVKIVTVQPDSAFHGLEGLKRMDSVIVPGIYDAQLADTNVEVRTEMAYGLVQELARVEGLLAGVSSGAALAAALELAHALSAEDCAGMVVMIFPDAGDRYLSEHFWSL